MFSHSLFEKLNRLDYDSALKVAMRKCELRAQNVLSLRGVKLRTEDMDDAEIAEVIRSRPAHFLSNTAFRLGPVALTTTLTTNIFNPGTTTGGVGCTGSPNDKLYVILNYIYIVNKTASAATASLWIGATGANAAGTEFYVQGTSVPANSMLNPPFAGRVRFGQADFLVGGAGTTVSLALTANGEIGIGA